MKVHREDFKSLSPRSLDTLAGSDSDSDLRLPNKRNTRYSSFRRINKEEESRDL